MTFHGENLNSVAEPRLIITTVISTVAANDSNPTIAARGDDDSDPNAVSSMQGISAVRLASYRLYSRALLILLFFMPTSTKPVGLGN